MRPTCLGSDGQRHFTLDSQKPPCTLQTRSWVKMRKPPRGGYGHHVRVVCFAAPGSSATHRAVARSPGVALMGGGRPRRTVTGSSQMLLLEPICLRGSEPSAPVTEDPTVWTLSRGAACPGLHGRLGTAAGHTSPSPAAPQTDSMTLSGCCSLTTSPLNTGLRRGVDTLGKKTKTLWINKFKKN